MITNPVIEQLSTTLDDPAEQDVSHVKCISSILIQLMQVVSTFIFLASFKRNATFQYNYNFKSIQNTSMQSRIAKVFKKHSFGFPPIMRGYDKKHGGAGGGRWQNCSVFYTTLLSWTSAMLYLSAYYFRVWQKGHQNLKWDAK